MKKAFTLAEVLITLGIIGVVAAMTMPTLIQNHQKRSLEVQTQKFYSMLSQAVRHYMADEGVDDLRNTQMTMVPYYNGVSPQTQIVEAQRDFITKYLKVVKECEQGTICFAENYKANNGGKILASRFPNDKGTNEREYVLSNGSIIRTNVSSNSCISLMVDVNGKKGPNRVGYDLWGMAVFYDGIVDEALSTPECRLKGECTGYGTTNVHDGREGYYNYVCKSPTQTGCFGHFLENNFKFDY